VVSFLPEWRIEIKKYVQEAKSKFDLERYHAIYNAEERENYLQEGDP